MDNERSNVILSSDNVFSRGVPIVKICLSTFLAGFGMWIEAGLYHNLLIPLIDKSAVAHHDGLFIMLMSYFLLSFLMSILFYEQKNQNLKKGLFFGMLIGILWVLPHGLTMAGAQNTSIVYEIKNAFWHIFEQGVGGIIIASVFLYRKKA